MPPRSKSGRVTFCHGLILQIQSMLLEQLLDSKPKFCLKRYSVQEEGGSGVVYLGSNIHVSKKQNKILDSENNYSGTASSRRQENNISDKN